MKILINLHLFLVLIILIFLQVGSSISQQIYQALLWRISSFTEVRIIDEFGIMGG